MPLMLDECVSANAGGATHRGCQGRFQRLGDAGAGRDAPEYF